MIPGGSIVLPLSWRSYLRAGFFTGMLLVFGVGAIATTATAIQIVGVVMTVTGLVAGADFAIFARRWRLAQSQLHLPTVWSPKRVLGVSSEWMPDLDDIGVRDSMFLAATSEGAHRVTPNLMVARSDVKQWLYLIGESRRGVR